MPHDKQQSESGGLHADIPRLRIGSVTISRHVPCDPFWVGMPCLPSNFGPHVTPRVSGPIGPIYSAIITMSVLATYSLGLAICLLEAQSKK